MKKIALLALMSVGVANAATVTVSAGFGTQGLAVTTGGNPLASFAVQIGSWNGSVFTPFGALVQDTAKVNGSFTATTPSTVNGQIMHLFVGSGNTVDFGGQYVLLKMNTNAAFPADVSSGTATATFNAAIGNNLTLIGSNQAQWNPTAGGGTINFVPEPSAALLGALGVLGLLRRRRN